MFVIMLRMLGGSRAGFGVLGLFERLPDARMAANMAVRSSVPDVKVQACSKLDAW
jgi:hypothetical protein